MAFGDRVQGIGVAGAPAGGVHSVQGVVGGTALPISGAVSVTGTVAVDVTDEPARQLGIVSVTGTVDVSDRAARALGIVASITAPVDVSDRAARLLGVVANVNQSQGYYFDSAAGIWRAAPGDGNTPVVRNRSAPLMAFVTGAANAGAVLTIPAAVGFYNVITYLRISRVATAALAGGALLSVAVAGVVGAGPFRTGNVMVAGGTTDLVNENFDPGLRSTAVNTAITFTAPAAGAAVSWDMQAFYYQTAFAA